jgi:hypothetical protein
VGVGGDQQLHARDVTFLGSRPDRHPDQLQLHAGALGDALGVGEKDAGEGAAYVSAPEQADADGGAPEGGSRKLLLIGQRLRLRREWLFGGVYDGQASQERCTLARKAPTG